eukprot:maker-scaffold699_size109694-snap-gene-0.16 protein:Tk03217 transcript:maker-scaffold699_size109694-snap-gene-0.16-mRNA-1 annotation:"kkiamre "
MDKYDNEGVVGEGSYGIVMKCRRKDNGQLVAIKKFLETDEDQTVKKIAMREIRMLKRLRHENLINLIEVFRKRKKLFLVFEFVEFTVLDELEENPKGLEAEKARSYVFQILRGIEFCHRNNIIHRDVKPENVLVSTSGVVKLCDFGFARLMAAPGENYTDYVATRWYRAPELLIGDSQYGKEVDIWAIGCVFAEMRTGDPLFPGESDIDQLYLITQLLGALSNRQRQIIARNPMFHGLNIQSLDPKGLGSHFTLWNQSCLNFLSHTLILDQTDRPDASHLLQEPFFTHDNFPHNFLNNIKSGEGLKTKPAMTSSMISSQKPSLTLAKQIKNLKKAFINSEVDSDKHPDLSPNPFGGGLKRYEGFDSDLNNLLNSAKQRRQDKARTPPSPAMYHTGSSASSKRRSLTPPTHGLDPDKFLEDITERSMIIDAFGERTTGSGVFHESEPTQLKPKQQSFIFSENPKILKKRRQTGPLSLPSVTNGASNLQIS